MAGSGVQLSVLGPVSLLCDGQARDLGPRKQRALLIRLLLDLNRPVSVDRLTEDLWRGTPPQRATASLQAYVSHLRRILEPERPARAPATRLVTQPPGYALRVPGDAVDAVRFRLLAAEASGELAAGDAVRAHEAAVAALGLWQGPALADVRDEPFAAAEIMRLEDLHLAVEEVRLAAALDLGRASETAAELESLVAAEPLREGLWELLILALYRSGRPAEALERYQRVRQLLDRELGLEPGQRLQQLERAVLRQDDAFLRQAPPPAAPSPPVALAPDRPGHGDLGDLTDAPAPRGQNSHGVGLDVSGRPPLVGRDALLATLTGALEAARTGVVRWTLLAGEAGMGKTRLAEAVADRAVEAGWHVAVARAHDDADTPSHWLWSQVLRGLRGNADGADPLTALAAEVRADAGLAEGARFALYEGIQRALTEEAGRGPLLVLLDDLHWADVDSLRALRFLAVQLRDLPLAFVVTLRDQEGGPALDGVVATLARQPGVDRIAVPPLDAGSVGVIAEALHGRPVDEDVTRRLHERSGGNPFFATELARLAIAPAGPADALPVAVKDAVGRRLDRLPPDVRGVLVLAAVTGLAFDATVLAPASDRDLPALLDLLDPALATGIVAGEDGTLRFRFAHALLREALLADLTVLQRQRLHARIAAALQRRARAAEGSPAEVAHHLLEAGPVGDLGAAVATARLAGEQALQRLAFHEAARWFNRALTALDLRGASPPDTPTRYELLVAEADALYRAGRPTEARERLVAAIDAATALGDLDAVAAAASALSDTGGVWLWVDLGSTPRAVLGRLERVIEQLGDGDSPARARLLSMVATGSSLAGEPEVVDALSADALAMARRLAAPRLLADVLLDRAAVVWSTDRCAEVVALADEALTLPDLTDLQVVVAQGRRFIGLLYLGELEAAMDAHRQATQTARDAHLVGPLMQLAHFPAALAIAEGRFAAARALIAEARALHDRGDLFNLAETITQVELVLDRHQGRLAEHLPFLRRLPSILPMRPSYELLALAHLAAGELPDAGAVLDESADAHVLRWLELPADAMRAEIRAALPPSDEDEHLVESLAPYEHMIAAVGTSYPFGPVALHLAALEHRLGRLDEAEGRLRRCIERSQGWGTRTWTALAQWRLAQVLADRGDVDGEGAGLRGQATAAAEEIGMVLAASGRQVD